MHTRWLRSVEIDPARDIEGQRAVVDALIAKERADRVAAAQ